MTDDPTRPRDPCRTALRELTSLPGGAELSLRGDGDTEVTGVTLDSRRVRPGDLYAALPGSRVHGIRFLDDALAAGAVAVLTDPDGASRTPDDVPVLVADAPREVLGRVAARAYGDPASRMRMIGVTGTQGKTTITRLAESGLLGSGTRAAVIGTVGTRIAGVDAKTALTTPEAPDLHGLFATMVEQQVEVCAMEVSSHALVMGRVDGVVFDVAAFCNLGRDHLDFHLDIEDYFAAKATLFTPERARRALICIDDEYGRRLAGLAAERGLEVRTYSGDPYAYADWTVSNERPTPAGTSFTIHTPDGSEILARSPLPGRFNVSNTLAAVSAATEVGLDPAAISAGIAAGAGVPGRLELVVPDPLVAGVPTVIVDYAHKPDAVEAVLETLRPLVYGLADHEGRLLVVIGAGGDRDTGKRSVMGEIAARLADVLIITDDNPRTEDPAAIRAAVLAGAEEVPDELRAELQEIGDRRAAIAAALERAEPGDVVLIAGKGHETGQEVDGVVHPFDDREVARELLDVDGAGDRR